MSNTFLESLAANTEQSVARRVKRRLADIEAALVDGYTHREILAQLNREGIAITSAYYHRLIPRLRSQTRARQVESSGHAAAGAASSTGSGAKRDETSRGSSQPTAAALPSARSELKADDLSQAITSTAGGSTSTILEKNASPRKFKWDPMGAEKLRLTTTQG